MKQFKRSDRLSEQILRDVSLLLEQEIGELGVGLVSFTRVKLSDDLKYATVYYSSLGDEHKRERVARYLEAERRRIRRDIGHGLSMRHIPEFSFKFDPSIENSVRIERLLNDIKSQQSE
jgi:ribosome-binding factor A